MALPWPASKHSDSKIYRRKTNVNMIAKEKTNKKEMNIKRMFVVLNCLQIIYYINKWFLSISNLKY